MGLHCLCGTIDLSVNTHVGRNHVTYWHGLPVGTNCVGGHVSGGTAGDDRLISHDCGGTSFFGWYTAVNEIKYLESAPICD